jgi:hypothetical protein
MHRLALLCAAFTFAAACSEDTLRPNLDTLPNIPGGSSGGGDVDLPPGTVPPGTCQTGGIMGRLCVPDESATLGGAEISLAALDCFGNVQTFSTQAASNGHFAIAGLPAGTHTVTVTHPDWSGTFQVTVVPGEIIFVGIEDPSAPLCSTPGTPRLAVIKGEYDQVQQVLNGLDLDYDLFESQGNPSPAGTFLSDLQQMMQYDVILFNCGRMERDFMKASITYTNPSDPLTRVISFNYEANTYANLRDFVLHGGNIYASDWAWPIAEGLNPEVIDFHGDESNAAQVNIGSEKTVVSDIMDEPLQMYMASQDLLIDFNLQGYAVIDGTSNARVYVQGDVPVFVQGSAGTETLEDRPLLVGFRPFPDGGVVLYTTFHYHAQPSGQMIQLLRYLIFQL